MADIVHKKSRNPASGPLARLAELNGLQLGSAGGHDERGIRTGLYINQIIAALEASDAAAKGKSHATCAWSVEHGCDESRLPCQRIVID